MAVDRDIARMVRLWPDDCQPTAAEAIRSAHSFSGAALWRLATPRGPLCLRRWPAEYPSPDRLQFIQAVLWHVDQEGFSRVPMPLETQHHHGFVRYAGHLWELAPWLPGAADYQLRPSPERLENALQALARFHQAARTFPLPENGPIGSPGLADRLLRLQGLLDGRLKQLRKAVLAGSWPELAERGRRLVELAATVGPKLLPALELASNLDVTLEPCIRDVWHAHILFVGNEVSGIVDFGAMRPDNVATDVARLLGSLAGDDRADWHRGLAAYQTVRRLTSHELTLVSAFDRSMVLMGGLQWLEWIYVEGREFNDPATVLARVDEFGARLDRLSQTVG